MSEQPTESGLEVQILSLEYNTLRAEILVLMSSRYQFLGFATAAAAILATGAGHLSLSPGAWLLAVLAGGIFLFGIGSFWYLGNNIALISMRVAILETRINGLAPAGLSDPRFLSWESEHQDRRRIGRWVLGYRVPRRQAATRSQSGNSLPSDP
jgi:hypothetical protein